ncbi:MAG TPA: DUF4383 domain-containing protein [Longimicrobiales bacterium]|nr:DUF4383 domain-containing protein [Longimicrobiales bacterium]
MSMIQRVAQILGWIFVAIALWGFFVSGGSMEADPAMAPKVMGLFAVNVLHNLVHLAFGVWGIVAARSIAGARGYALWAGAIYLFLAVLGFVTPTTFGLIPIGGNDIWLHALIALVLLGAWAASRSATAAPAAPVTTTTTSTPPPSGTGRPTTTPPSGTDRPSTPPPSGTGRPTTPPPGGSDRPPAPPPTGGPDRPATPPPSSPDRPATPPPSGPDRPATPPPPPSGGPDRGV